jgi:hypothetical protein
MRVHWAQYLDLLKVLNILVETCFNDLSQPREEGYLA